MDESVMHERLARIEASLEHVVKAVDKAQEDRDTASAQLVRLETRVGYIEGQIPQVRENSIRAAERDGAAHARDDSETDTRARWALGISTLAFLASLASTIKQWFNGGAP